MHCIAVIVCFGLLCGTLFASAENNSPSEAVAAGPKKENGYNLNKSDNKSSESTNNGVNVDMQPPTAESIVSDDSSSVQPPIPLSSKSEGKDGQQNTPTIPKTTTKPSLETHGVAIMEITPNTTVPTETTTIESTSSTTELTSSVTPTSTDKPTSTEKPIPTENSTTVSPSTPPTPPSSSSSPPVTSPKAPETTILPSTAKPANDRRFDGPSFIGGIVFALGVTAIAFVAWKFYKARTERNYHTL